MKCLDDVVLIQVALLADYVLLALATRCSRGGGGGGGGGWERRPGTGREGRVGWTTDTVRTVLGDEAGLEEETLVLVLGEVPTPSRHNTPEYLTCSQEPPGDCAVTSSYAQIRMQ